MEIIHQFFSSSFTLVSISPALAGNSAQAMVANNHLNIALNRLNIRTLTKSSYILKTLKS
jgi:hypothetical protein